MKERFVPLFVGFALLGFGVLLPKRDQIVAQAPTAEQDSPARRFTILAQRGVKVQTTPPALPPPGVTLAPSGELVFPKPPTLDDEELDRAARAQVEQTPLAPRVKGPCKNDPDLFVYIAARKEALKNVQSPRGELYFPAVVNFKRPIKDAEVESLVQDYCLKPGSLFYVTNSADSGSFCYGCDRLASAEERLHTHVDSRLRVEGYISLDVLATPEDLRRLDIHPEVLLVDPGVVEEVVGSEYKYTVRFPERIFWRYEQACR